MSSIFTPCVKLVESGLVSAGLPCSRLLVEIRCRLTRTHYLQKSATSWRFLKIVLLSNSIRQTQV